MTYKPEKLRIGCISHRFMLFANQDSDLVIVQSGSGGGLVTILPAFVYGKLMAIFPRLPEYAP